MGRKRYGRHCFAICTNNSRTVFGQRRVEVKDLTNGWSEYDDYYYDEDGGSVGTSCSHLLAKLCGPRRTTNVSWPREAAIAISATARILEMPGKSTEQTYTYTHTPVRILSVSSKASFVCYVS